MADSRCMLKFIQTTSSPFENNLYKLMNKNVNASSQHQRNILIGIHLSPFTESSRVSWFDKFDTQMIIRLYQTQSHHLFLIIPKQAMPNWLKYITECLRNFLWLQLFLHVWSQNETMWQLGVQRWLDTCVALSDSKFVTFHQSFYQM